MPFPSHSQRPLAGALLVALQFGLLLWLGVLAAPRLAQGELPLTSGLLLVLSSVLAAWTLAHNRLGNFNIRPAPKEDGVLVTTGPYRLIRHPMYTSVLLGATALAGVPGSRLSWLIWVALVLVLMAKALLEERWVAEHHAGYGAYCQRSKRFVPWIF